MTGSSATASIRNRKVGCSRLVFAPTRTQPANLRNSSLWCRRHEIASLLANGLARLRISGAEQSANIAAEGEFEQASLATSAFIQTPSTRQPRSPNEHEQQHLQRRHRWQRKSPGCPICRWPTSGPSGKSWSAAIRPPTTVQFLERRIAYRLQEAEFRKVDANLLDRNQRRIASLVKPAR